MPAAHDIYSDQLRELRRGHALYYPEPSPDEGPVEIGDVGYTRQGAFCRLFNVARPADDRAQILGVPEGFQPLNMGRIRIFDAALEPGPLHSKTIFRVNADIGSPGAVLPADASFRFSCTSSRGAILMLETQMNRQQALHETLFKSYLLQHCLSWYTFARDLGVQVEFGDIMLVTECSKAAAWASAVYSQSSKEFGMSFSAGGTFLPSAGGIAVSAGHERIGPVEYRRSQRRAIEMGDMHTIPKDHTVFIKAYRLGSRSLYLRSLARKIMKAKNRPREGSQDQDDSGVLSPTGPTANRSDLSYTSLSRSSQPSNGSSDVMDGVSNILPEYPDFHPAVALLAHVMETTNVEIAAVHDDEWCSTYSRETTRIIDEYVQCFFNEDFLDFGAKNEFDSMSRLSLEQSDRKSITASEEIARSELMRDQGISDTVAAPNKMLMPSILQASSLQASPERPLPTPSRVPPTPTPKASSTPPTAPPPKHTMQSNPAQAPPVDWQAPLSPLSGSNNYLDSWRIALLGDGGVGKTALAIQTYEPTIEDAYRRLLPVDERKCYIEVIDTAGQEEYATLLEQWVREGQAFALVYSVSSRATFKRIEEFRRMIVRVKTYCPYFVLVANKIDKLYERVVSTQEGEALAEKLGCQYIEASAKTGIRVQKVFFDLVRKLRGASKDGNSGLSQPTSSKSLQLTRAEGRNRSCIVM